MCSFAELNRSKLDICTNLQKKHCIGEQIFLAGNGAPHVMLTIYFEMDFGEFA